MTRRPASAICQGLAIFAAFCLTLANAQAQAQKSAPACYPYNISAKYATTTELATTNLARGQLVVNQDEWTDLRIGDGETPGGVPVGRHLFGEMNALHEWGGATADEIRAFLALSIADQVAPIRSLLSDLQAATNSFATTNALAEVSAVASAATNAISEYWCKWTTNSLSTTATNWIPTNWPAKTVYCLVHANAANLVVALPDWTPDDSRTLHARIYKPAEGSIVIRTADGTALQTMSSGSANYREIEFAFRPGIGWIVSLISISNIPVVVNGASRTAFYTASSSLPEDSAFAPVILTE